MKEISYESRTQDVEVAERMLQDRPDLDKARR